MTATPATPIRYRAFLPYAHADRRTAEWLHRAIERYRFDRDLVGRATPLGPVPASLRPIFRDREVSNSTQHRAPLRGQCRVLSDTRAPPTIC